MKRKRLSALIMAIIIICLTLMPSYVSASDAIKLMVLDATPGTDGNIASYLVDGSKENSWGMNWWNGTTTAYAIIKASRQVTPEGYTITTGEDARSYQRRNPRDWKLYGCNDYDEASKKGGEWILLHSVTNDNVLQDINRESYNYYIDNDMPYSYYKLEITANKGNNYLKVGEFSLFEATESFGAVDGKTGVNNSENYTNLFDNNVNTKYCVKTGGVYVVAINSRDTVVTGYTFTTGNDTKGEPGRNPKSWVLYGSNDYNQASNGGTWNEIHSVTNDTKMQAENYASYSFTIDNNTTPYKYYKFEFNEVQSGDLMQLSEIKFEYTSFVHNWINSEKAAPACTQTGSIKQTCTDCGKERTLEIAALGHDWAEVSKDEPTCSEVGHSYQKCSMCQETKTVEIPTTDHNLAEVSREEPTCTEPGLIERRCLMCGFAEKSVIPPLGHSEGENNTCIHCKKNVIRVGEQYYYDLQKAVDSAKSGDTIEILQDMVISSRLKISKDLTIELNGFKITQTAEDRVIEINDKITFTLKDSSKDHTGMILGGSALGGLDDGCGGGVYVGTSATFNMIGGTISGCSAKNDGGGIFVQNTAKLNMSNGAVIKDCTSTNPHGGGITNKGIADIRDSKIINCKSWSGGGIYTDGSKGEGTLDLYNTIIEECTSTTNGGGGIRINKAQVTVNNTIIRKNHAPGNYGGGIFATDNSSVQINDSTIEENNADGEGGGICATVNTSVEIKNSSIKANTANNGGGIYAGNESDVTLNGSDILKNKASKEGGGIKLNSSTLTIDIANINNNTTSVDGGGIYAINKSNIIFTCGSINENSAAWGGGVYLHMGSDIEISGESYISNNTAKYNGGGVIINDEYNGDSPTLTMTGGTISYNKALGEEGNSNGNGGGICGQKKAVINISGGSISSNTALNGGGIQLFNGSAAAFSGGDISNNIAKSGNGGGVYVDSNSSMQLDGGLIMENHAIGLGGGIYNDSLNFSVANDPHVMGNYISKYIADDEGGYAEPLRGSNIHLVSGKKILGSLKEVVAPPMIYVTLANKSQDITDVFENDCSSYIHSDDEYYMVVYDEQTKTHKLAERINSIELTEEGYIVQGSVESAVIYLASYDSFGTLVDAVSIDATENNRQMLFRKLNFKTDGASKIMAFLWDRNMRPLCKKDSIEIKPSAEPLIGISDNGFYVNGFSGKANAYIATYNQGALIGMHVEAIDGDYSINSYTKSFADIEFNADGADKINAFLWDESMQPLCGKAQ